MVKSACGAHGHRTKKGGTFGVGPTHHILTNTAYVAALAFAQFEGGRQAFGR
jgi:hypothetical protein